MGSSSKLKISRLIKRLDASKVAKREMHDILKLLDSNGIPHGQVTCDTDEIIGGVDLHKFETHEIYCKSSSSNLAIVQEEFELLDKHFKTLGWEKQYSIDGRTYTKLFFVDPPNYTVGSVRGYVYYDVTPVTNMDMTLP